MRGWEPFCCEVCFDSTDAQERRLMEAGAYRHLSGVVEPT